MNNIIFGSFSDLRRGYKMIDKIFGLLNPDEVILWKNLKKKKNIIKNFHLDK